MEFYEVLARRYMVRAFQPKPVEDEKVERILRKAWRSPSAGHTQPVEFVVVKDQGVKDELARAALNQTFIAEAPVVIVTCSDTSRSASRYGQRGVRFYSIIDGAFASMIILLSAVNEGLGACFVGAYYDEEVKEVLRLPDHVRPIGIIPIGYPAEKPYRYPRMSLKRIVHRDRW